jgi:hypothetical protein
MKQKPLFLTVATLLGALSMPLSAQTPGGSTGTVTKQTSPGKGTITRTRQIVATVEEVDAQKGFLAVKGPENRLLRLTVGPEVRNLAQVKVGDRLVVRYSDALSLRLMKDGKELRASSEMADAARAPVGARPAGTVAEQVTVTADVIAVDRKNQSIRLRGPKQTVDLFLEDPKQLELVKVGDQVEAVYRQAAALSVEPAGAAKK